MTNVDKIMEDFLKKKEQEEADNSYAKKATRYIDNLGMELMSGLAPIAKGVDVIATPFTEAIRAPFKYIAENVGENTSQTPDVNTLAAYESLKPSDRIGLGLLAKDINNAMGIKTYPMMSEETKDSISQYAPNIANIAHTLSDPSEIAGLVGEGGVAKAATMGSRAGKIANKVINPLPTVIEAGKNLITAPAQIVEDVTKIGSRLAMKPNPSEIASTVRDELFHYPRKAGEYFKNKLSDRGMSENYLKATAENRPLLAELMKTPGAVDDMVDMLVNNPEMVDPLNRGKALDIIEGPVIKDESGRRVRDRSQGQLGKFAETQSDIISSIPDQSSVWLDELAESAKNNLSKDLLTETQRSSADKLINEIVGQNLADEAHLQRIANNEDILRRIEKNTADSTVELNRVLSEKRGRIQDLLNETHDMEDYLKNPRYREDLQWLSDIEVVQDMENVFPKRYKTEAIDFELPDGTPSKIEVTNEVKRKNILDRKKPRPIDLIEKNYDLTDVMMGQQKNPEFIDNIEKLKKIREIEELSAAYEWEINNLTRKEVARNQDYARYNQLLNEYEELQRIKNSPSFLTGDNRQSYYERLHSLNIKPATTAINDIRKRSNQMIKSGQAVGVDPLDAAPRTNAGRAVEQAATDALYSLEGFGEGSPLRSSYEDVNRAITARKRFQELNPLARTEEGITGTIIPQGRMDTGLAARALSLGDSTVYPMANKASNWMARQGMQYNNAISGRFITPASIQKYKIPRDTQRAFDEKEIIFRKLFEEIGEDVSQDFSKISNDPDAIKVFMRNIEAIRPDLFEKDRYGRIDGIIQDPELKKAALKDMMMDRNLPPIQRADKLEKLLINGEYLV